MSDPTLLAMAHSQVMKSLHYPEATREWELLPAAAKTWIAWQAHYRAANIARNRLLKLNPLAFGAANHVTDTGFDTAAITSALDSIANAATNDSNIIAGLITRIKALEARPPAATAPTARPSPAPTTAIIANTAPSQAIVPYVPYVFTQAQALRKFDVNGYCWTHGCRAHKNHTSATCKKRAIGHMETATKANMMGGSTKHKGWETNPNPM
jgi:hypothetical protein